MPIFAAAVLFLIVTAGPGVTTAAGFGAAYGFRPSLAHAPGLFIGVSLVTLSVMTGLAAIILSAPSAGSTCSWSCPCRASSRWLCGRRQGQTQGGVFATLRAPNSRQAPGGHNPRMETT